MPKRSHYFLSGKSWAMDQLLVKGTDVEFIQEAAKRDESDDWAARQFKDGVAAAIRQYERGERE